LWRKCFKLNGREGGEVRRNDGVKVLRTSFRLDFETERGPEGRGVGQGDDEIEDAQGAAERVRRCPWDANDVKESLSIVSSWTRRSCIASP
jgi:hypothetical protein